MTLEEKEMLKKENEEKKKYLRQYRNAKLAAEEIEEEIAEVRRIQMQPAIKSSDGMPHGTDKRDLSDYAVEIDYLISKLIKARYKRVKTYNEIYRKIENLENEEEKRVLTLRYIKCMEWEEIRKRMNFSLRRIYQIHGNALKNIKIE